jgi:hypothetical protein
VADSDKSSLHTWVNSLGTVLALIVAMLSAYFSWQGIQLKAELVSFTQQPTDCPIKFSKIGEDGVVGVCWNVIVANQSEIRLSIVKTKVFAFDRAEAPGKRSTSTLHYSHFSGFWTDADKSVTLPIILDGGESKAFLVYFPVRVVPEAAAIAVDFLKEFPAGTVSALSKRLADHGLDFVGNNVEQRIIEGRSLRSINPPVKFSSSILHVETGRGGIFFTQVSSPPGMAGRFFDDK